jgi:hypothetical protein
MVTAKQMQSNSTAAQIKKYGGKEGYQKEMARRSKLANEKRWGKKPEEKKTLEIDKK